MMDLKIRIRTLEILLFQNDLLEVNDWIDELESVHHELGIFFAMEKKLLGDDKIRDKLRALRRVNTLEMARLCKYQQSIKTQMDYTTDGYCESWIKTHQKQRDHYKNHLNSYRVSRMDMFKNFIK